MSPEDVDQYLNFNEPKGGPPRRLLLNLADETYAIVLLNDEGLLLGDSLSQLEGTHPVLEFSDAFRVDHLRLDFPKPPKSSFERNNRERKFNAWEVFFDGSSILIPTKSSKAAALPVSIGIVITGKENLPKASSIARVRFLGSHEPTPFIGDKYGDSWNSNYQLEPRIIESVSSTVFDAIKNILLSASLAFNENDFETATLKYEKAYHYCHSYFPDTLPDEDLETATSLKLRSLSNLSFAALRCATIERYTTCVEACNVLLQMPECVGVNRAKAYYRLGKATLMLGDDVQAKHHLQQSFSLVPDPMTKALMQECEIAAAKRTSSMKRRLATAFKNS